MVEHLSLADVERLIARGRRIHGAAAVLLPHRPDGTPDPDAFAQLVAFVSRHGLTPAINMDTGYGELLTPAQRHDVLRRAAQVLSGRPFIAGVYVDPQSADLGDAYRRGADEIRQLGGTPILFPSPRLKALDVTEQRAVFRRVASGGGPLLAFELSLAFSGAGFLFPDELFREVLELPAFAGLKHSSLSRRLEWRRLALRNEVRKGFRIYTGNDLAIDMVMYGSDYLLGLAAFAPDAFAMRDALWETGDARFFELNDVLQYLGQFAFRPPVPAYKHSAAQFLHLRGLVPSDTPHPQGARRPESDRAVLEEIASRLQRLLATLQDVTHRQRPAGS